ncbi:hypothetical protein HanOQP8_Chr12g0445551 [Helianthus annuus]|nr:hypothetical protein HanOQP8_Chr12g0445551 [Helianthus annuus]
MVLTTVVLKSHSCHFTLQFKLPDPLQSPYMYVIEDPFCESALDCLERCLKKRIQVKKKMCQRYKCKKKKKIDLLLLRVLNVINKVS